APAGRPARPGERPPGHSHDSRDSVPQRPPPGSDVTPRLERVVACRGRGGSTTRLARASPVAAGLHRGAVTSAFDAAGTGLACPLPGKPPPAPRGPRHQRRV